MKKIKQILKKLKSNVGSSVVMVIVAVAFIGIVVGALLAAAVQSYRLKLQELNSRDNFYYVEQALNEIYAGVGSQTVEDLQNAYVYTVENMVEYSLEKQRYITKSQEEAQEMFTAEFYRRMLNNPFFKSGRDELAAKLSSYISNDSVKLDASRMLIVDYKDENGKNIGKIIKNLKLCRTQEYSKSVANGVFTQSITTDIVIGEPDFAVIFDSINDNDPNIFKYALVADMGVEVKQPTVPLTIAGNIYAASDFYNKQYNASTWDETISEDGKTFGDADEYKITKEDGEEEDLSKTYIHGNVTSKRAIGEQTSTAYTYYNKNATQTGTNEIAGKYDYYDGITTKSKYSGFYVDGSQVSVLADTVVVPGTMAVMDKGSLSIYGKDGVKTAKSEVWTDNIILDGYSTVHEVTAENGRDVKTVYRGADMLLKADVYVKDDTEVNAAGSNFQITGSYFGYGDSTERDARVFTPVVDTEVYQIEVKDANGNSTYENRGHYNSSAIIVNGEQSSLDLSQAKSLFLAGRTYIELSKDVTVTEGSVRENDVDLPTVKDTYTYHPYDYDPEMPDLLRNENNKTTTIRDYKMGESISIKSNQAAYIPVTYNGIPTLAKDSQGKSLGYYLAELPPALKPNSTVDSLFQRYFPDQVFAGKVPCILQEISGKKYYYYDFNVAYKKVDEFKSRNLGATAYEAWKRQYPSAQYFAAGFISDYSAELEMHRIYEEATDKRGLTDSTIAEYLTDISDYEDFEVGDIILPDAEYDPAVSIYSSGAITTKLGTTFSIVRSDDTDIIDNLLDSTKLNEDLSSGVVWSADASNKSNDMNDVDRRQYSVYTDAYQLCNDLELEYDIVRWNLGHLSEDEALDPVILANNRTEKAYIKDFVADDDFGDASITPINKFLDFSQILPNTKIEPNISGTDSGAGILDLACGYSVWVDYKDVTVKAKAEDKGVVRGIVITKGDVYFDTSETNGVTEFEGVIVAGGKVYVNGNVETITASPELCRTVLRECKLSGGDEQELLLKLFRGYESKSGGNNTEDATDTDAKSIGMIDYTDVVSLENFMKNVE